MLGAKGELVKEIDQMVRDKVGGVLAQFPVGEPADPALELRGGGKEEGKPGDGFQSAIDAFDDHSNFKKEMNLFVL